MASCNSRSLRILVLHFPLLSVLIPLVSPLSFSFTGNQLDKLNLNFSGNASFDGSIVQLTKNQVGVPLGNSVGRATYSEPVLLWDKASGTLANFTTNFTFSIDSFGKNASADGLAFFLSPFPFVLDPSSSFGGSLGLFNSTGNNKTKNMVVAVEFDTYWNTNYSDSSSDHVGIDIGSIVSIQHVDLKSSIRQNVQFIAPVGYNAVTQNLSVFLSNASDPQRNWSLSYVVDLRDYLPENVTIGFSASTRSYYESHCIYA